MSIKAADEALIDNFSPSHHRQLFRTSLLGHLSTQQSSTVQQSPSTHLSNMVYASLNVFFAGIMPSSTPMFNIHSQPRSMMQHYQNLWTPTDQMILVEEMKDLVGYKRPKNSLPPLTECHDGVIRVMGEYFKRRALREHVDNLQPISERNKVLIKRIFEEFVSVKLIRAKDLKLYRDFFWEFDN